MLEEASRMKLTPLKRRFWPVLLRWRASLRNQGFQPQELAEVLGITLGQSSRRLSPEEDKRWTKAERVARRIGQCRYSLQNHFGCYCFRPYRCLGMRVWGPNASGGEARGDRRSRDLQKFLQLGHMSCVTSAFSRE